MEHFLQFVVFKIRIYLEADDLTILSCMHKGHFSSARKQFYLKSEKIEVCIQMCLKKKSKLQK